MKTKLYIYIIQLKLIEEVERVHELVQSNENKSLKELV